MGRAEDIAELQRRYDDAGLPGKVCYRHDQATGLKLEPPEETPEGYLLIKAKVARPCILEYANEDGSIRREVILAEDLHDEASLKTLGRKPFTLLHPDEDVDVDNYDELAAGDVGEVVKFEPPEQGGHVIVSLAVKRADAIKAIKSGEIEETSPGYLTRVVEEPGADPSLGYPGNEEGRWDARQTNRRYNHVAGVPEARGGPTVRMTLDAAGSCVTKPATDTGENAMDWAKLITLLALLPAMPRTDRADPEKVKAALIGAEVPEEDAAKIAETLAQVAAEGGEEEVDDGDEDLETVKGQRDTFKQQLKDLKDEFEAFKTKPKEGEDAHEPDKPKEDEEPTEEEKKADAAAKQTARLDWFSDRAGVVAMAQAYEIPADEIKKLDNADLKRAVVKAARDSVPDDATQAYIDASYDILGDERSKREDAEDPYAHISFASTSTEERKVDAASAFDIDEDDALASLRNSQTARFAAPAE